MDSQRRRLVARAGCGSRRDRIRAHGRKLRPRLGSHRLELEPVLVRLERRVDGRGGNARRERPTAVGPAAERRDTADRRHRDQGEAARPGEVPGGTIIRVETDADGHAAYEAHMVKADGTPVTVYVNQQFQVVSMKSGMPGPASG
jgi:hypothetical protein